MPAIARPDFSPRCSFNAYDALRVGHSFFTALLPELGVRETFELFAELIEPKPALGCTDPAYWLDWLDICAERAGLSAPQLALYPDWRRLLEDYDIAALRLNELTALQAFLRFVQDRVTRLAYSDLAELLAVLDMNLQWLPATPGYWERWLECCTVVAADGETDISALLSKDRELLASLVADGRFAPRWAE